jgi:hypothetical protein
MKIFNNHTMKLVLCTISINQGNIPIVINNNDSVDLCIVFYICINYKSVTIYIMFRTPTPCVFTFVFKKFFNLNTTFTVSNNLFGEVLLFF